MAAALPAAVVPPPPPAAFAIALQPETYPPRSVVLARARRLRDRVLPPDLLRSWEERGCVDVPSILHPGRIYRILRQERMTGEPWIEVWVHGRHYAGACLHIQGIYNLEDDALVAKYLVCRHAEEEIDRVAIWRYYEGAAAERELRNADPIVVRV